MQDEILRFYSSISSRLVDIKPNMVMCFNVLEYLPNPMNFLMSICVAKSLF